jgi:predicted DNA-binding protein (UPF0251 family)
MPRPKKERCCQEFNGDLVFKPRSIPMTDLHRVLLEMDELEAMRLCDLEGLDQEAAGQQMRVSRGTIFRLLKSGRSKVMSALTNSHALIVNKPNPKETL